MGERRFERARIALLLACGFYASLGILVAAFGAELFGVWRDAVSAALGLGDTLPPELAQYVALTEGILGASIAGKWVATAWLVAVPVAQRSRWALRAVLASHLTWFVVDSTSSIARGVAINVALINLFPFVVVVVLVALLWRGTLATASMAHSASTSGSARPTIADARVAQSVRLLSAVCIASVVVGVLAAGAMSSPLFAPYLDAIAATYFDGTLPAAAMRWTEFIYGLIGGTFAGHFVALVGALRGAPTSRWPLAAVATSMLTWFVIDTTASLVRGGAFNVLYINLPSLLLVSLPLSVAVWWSSRGRGFFEHRHHAEHDP